MLIGLPGSGKSTLREVLSNEYGELPAASTDDFLEAYAKENGMTYGAAHKDAYEKADKAMRAEVVRFVKNKIDFVWDQTNVVRSARKKKIRHLTSSGFEVFAYEIIVPPFELVRRIKEREEKTGKRIGRGILMRMTEEYESPEYEEGFAKIYKVDESSELVLLNLPMPKGMGF